MSHKPLSYLPKQEISSPQLVLQVFYLFLEVLKECLDYA